MIATPCAHGMVTEQYASSLFGLTTLLLSRGVEAALLTTRASDLEYSRNQLAALMLSDSSFTHLLFIDSDMSFRPGLVGRMLDFDEDFVSSVYVKRGLNLERLLSDARPEEGTDRDALHRLVSRNMEYTLYPVMRDGKAQFEIRSGFAKVQGTGMGLCLLRRRVFEDMITRGVAKKKRDHHPDMSTKVPFYGFFDHVYMDFGDYISEDFSFCHRWVFGCAGEIWACVDEPIGHHGMYEFRGTYLDKIKAN